ncbi:PAAR-like protein [Sebaldella sp. S0638]|uniref:PAAR-like protein n=1 Tax=Sebaldella sp. S0638 TaxID=2957809 RepID=UPI00209DD5F7|nr:PAAR-like protein [Sebaldella sp. S0638]MCP1223059.1 DUF4280 domain-containing protein [Sebaldella sp. S0638]
MVYTEYKGKKLNEDAIEFFDKLGQHESTNNYNLLNSYGYMGKYQVGRDIMKDLNWYSSSMGYIGEAREKWGIQSRKNFLGNPAAQDDLIMKSMVKRWDYLDAYLKKHTKKGIMDYVCKEITVHPHAVYTDTRGNSKGGEALLRVLKNGKNKKLGNPKGKKFFITISGLLAGSHLTGQGGMGIFLSSGGRKIPTDGNGTMVLVYMEELKGHDLSMICGHKDNCRLDNIAVVKNDSFKDEIILKEEMNKGSNKTSTAAVSQEVPEKEEKGIYEFKGQKYEEVWDTEFYKEDKTMRKQPPAAGYVEAEEAVIKRLEEKFINPDLYNGDYIKYVESKTGKTILEENKEEINIMLALYDKATKAGNKPGNIVRQYGFDVLRGRNEKSELLRIQDVAYYMYYYPIPKMGQLETLEYVFSKFAAKYVKFPDVHYTENKKTGEFQIAQIAQLIKDPGKKKEEPVIKYNLPEKYDKYMERVKDIDEILLRVPKKEKEYFHKMRSENLLRGLEMAGEHRKSFSVDENSVRKYPLARRFLDNLLMEFIKVETGFKGEKEEKYFDGHKYRDSNILRNYFLWYDENFGRIELPHPDRKGMYDKLEKLGKDMRITTMLDIWINSKERNKIKHIRKIHNLIIDNYGDYTDGKTAGRDRGIITGHFPDVKELRDYAAGKDSMNLYSFYREFYDLKNIITPADEFYVNENCILKCTLGEGISRINVSRDSVILRGGKQANIKDKNILPFRSCKSASACKPELLDMWEKNTDAEVGGVPALLDISTIKCKYGGIISIDNPGQKQGESQPAPVKPSAAGKNENQSKGQNSGKGGSSSASVGTAKTNTLNTKPSKREVDCGYRSLLEICVAINKNFMQTSLKKECQNYRKYKKDNDAIIAERKRLYGIWKEAEKERIRPGDYFGETLKKATIKEAKRRYDDFEARIRDKERIASRNSARDRRLLLMGKINAAAESANSKAKNMSVPKKDVKGVYQKYGDTACDFDKRKFYDTGRFGSIVYGYLKAAMGEKTDEKTLREIEKEINQKEAEEKRKRNTYPNIGGVSNYETYDKIQERQIKKSQEIKTKVDVQTLDRIGYELYQLIEEVPTGNSILAKIREKMKSVTGCPFGEVERNANHGGTSVSGQEAVSGEAALGSGNSGNNNSRVGHTAGGLSSNNGHSGVINPGNDHMTGVSDRQGNSNHQGTIGNRNGKPVGLGSHQGMIVGDKLLDIINGTTVNTGGDSPGNGLSMPDLGSKPESGDVQVKKGEGEKPKENEKGTCLEDDRCPNSNKGRDIFVILSVGHGMRNKTTYDPGSVSKWDKNTEITNGFFDISYSPPSSIKYIENTKIVEFQTNDILLKNYLIPAMKKYNINGDILAYRTNGITNHAQTLNKIAVELKKTYKKVIVLEFHFNDAETEGKGTEMLYHSGREQTKKLAECMQKEIVKKLRLRDRGLKDCKGGRGGVLMQEIPSVPAIMLEPFFISTWSDTETFF